MTLWPLPVHIYSFMADPLHNSEKTLNGQEKYIDILNYGPYTSLRKKTYSYQLD